MEGRGAAAELHSSRSKREEEALDRGGGVSEFGQVAALGIEPRARSGSGHEDGSKEMAGWVRGDPEGDLQWRRAEGWVKVPDF